jgi:hypothetical protein
MLTKSILNERGWEPVLTVETVDGEYPDARDSYL